MRIGIDVTPILYEGTGVGEYTRQLVGELLRENPKDEFVLFFSTLRGRNKIESKIKELDSSLRWNDNKKRNYTVVNLPLPPAVWQFVWNKLNLIKIEWLIGKVDVFHCWDYLIPPSNCPRIVTIHDLTPLLYPETHTPLTVNNFKIVLEKIKDQKIPVLTVSENSKKDLVIHAKLDEKLVHVVYNGKMEVENVVHTSENKYGKYILSVGTREPRKNLEKAIEAFASIAEKYPEMQLVIVGKYGWGDDKLIINNEKLIKNKIKILGFVAREKLVQLYINAVCLVYPSLYEGFGLPVLEAMQFGCPVVTSNTSSLPEVGGDAALYINPHDVQEIKNSMIRIIESDDLRHNLIEKGKKQAEKFSWEKCARETYQIYNVTARSPVINTG